MSEKKQALQPLPNEVEMTHFFDFILDYVLIKC